MGWTGTERIPWTLAGGLVLAFGLASPAHAARFGVPTNLNAAGQFCTAVGTPAGCTAVSADPPGWFVLERLDAGSTNGDIVHQIRFFIAVTGTTLDVRVFDAGLSAARDLGRAVGTRYRLLDPNGAVKGNAAVTVDVDTATTGDRLARFACRRVNSPLFTILDTPLNNNNNQIWGNGTGRCTPLAAGLYVFEVTIQGSTGDPTYEGRNAFGVEFRDAAGNPYNAYTLGDADDTIATVDAGDTSMITGAVAGDRPTANVSGYTAFFPYVNRGCTIETVNFDLDADNAEGNGSVATLVDTVGAANDLARSDNDDVATTTVSVEPTGVTNLDSINYGMFTLRTQLDEWATAQNHVDWRIADFQGSAQGTPANHPRLPTSPIRTYLPNDYSACAASGCALVAPQEPVLAVSAVLLSGENPPLPGGTATRFAMTATVGNPGTTAITNVQVTVPLATGATYVANTQLGTIDGAAATCTDASSPGPPAYRRCTFATLAAGSYASLGFEIDFQPAATGVRNLTGPPAAGDPPPDTTVWAQYTPASQSTSYPRAENLGPLCQLAVNAAPISDLRLDAPTDAPDPVTAGTNVTYTFQLRNLGTATAPNASVTDVLPPGTTFVSATPPAGWSCLTPPVGSTGTVRCSNPSFPTLTTVTFSLVVRVDSTVPNGTVLTNSASATSGNTDDVPANNTVAMTTTVASPAANADLAVTKADTPDPVPAGRDLTYTIVVTNNGPATAISVTLTDAVPANTTFRSVSWPGGWSCATPPVGGTGTVSCTLASLPSGQLSAVTLRVRVDAGAAAGSTISNTASVSSTVNDPIPGNDSATATSTVSAANTCPTPGKDGPGGTLSGTVNSYYPARATAVAGSTSIVLGPSRGAAATIAVGDLVLVVQMQDATIDSTNADSYGDATAGDGEARGAVLQNNAGGYEYAVAASAVGPVGGTLTLSQGLRSTYTSTVSGVGLTRAGGVVTATTPVAHGLVAGNIVTVAGATQPEYNGTFTVTGATATTFTYTIAATPATPATGTITATRAETAGGQGQRRFQVVRVPQYTTATLGPTLIASYWDGSSGGILAFDVQGALALGSTTVSVTGRGFRGGGAQQRGGQAGGSPTAYVSQSTTNYHSSKGEGTAGTPRYVYDPSTLAVANTGAEGYPNGSFARGAPGTAGGGGTDSDPATNQENSGGGGGGNGGLGGRGGNAWRSNEPVGGFGGGGIPADPGLATLGGGGGAGSRNNSIGDESSASAGGGIVMIRADSLTGTGTIEADGLSANTVDTTPDNDGGGGGGAGGTVLVFAPNGGLGGLTVNARGGRGSDAWPTVVITDYPGERHGPGGGGGGGRVFLSGTPAAAGVSGGVSGTTSQTPEVFGASDGNAGTVSEGLVVSQIPGIDTTGTCSALATTVADVGVSVSGPADTINACTAATYDFTVVNNGPDAALSATAFFPIPASTTFQSLVPASGWACATPPAGGTGTVSCTRATFPAGASSTFSLTLRVNCGTAAGTLVAVTGAVGTSSTDTYSPNDTTATANLVGPAIMLLTRASIRGVRVDRDGLVEFATGWQHRTAGFHLYQTADAEGRRGLEPLTAERIPAPRPDSQLPILYSARTTPITAPFLVIEEIERGGERRLMGPFAVGDARQEALLEQMERRLARAGAYAASVSSAARARVVPLAPREAAARSRLVPERPRTIERRRPRDPASVKIETLGEGMATVLRESLGTAGLPVGVRLAACRLTSLGRPVPFEVRDEGGVAEALVFRAEALETLYSSRNVYVLTWAGRLPAPVVPLTREADPTRTGWHRVGRPLLYVPSVPPGTDPWLWDQLVPGFGTWPYEWDPTAGTFDVPGWPDGAPATVPVRLRFQGMTAHRHVVSVSLNGESLGTVEFEGASSAYLDASASQLRSSANELRIDYATGEGDPDGYAYLDYLDLLRPAGWQDPPVAATVRPFDDSLPPPGAEYLIVTHPLFAAQAERLAEAKRREGMKVTVADVESAYDRLSGGVPEAMAVRALVRRAAARGALLYVLLLGDDSFDPDDRAGFGGRAFVPSLNGWDGIFGRVASENRYADVDGDGRPEVAIGRLPARTVGEADALVDKVERQEALLAPGAFRHVFAVDDPGPDGFDFAAEARATAARLPRRAQAWADVADGVAAARGRLFSALAEGAAFTHYFGHGGPETWADEGLLTVEDAATLPSTGTVVLAWSCQTQFFQYLFGPSVNESLMLKPNGGAVAAFGPFGITDAPLQTALSGRLYDELRRGRVALGEAIRRAKERTVDEDPAATAVVEGWNLLGDPSLRVSAGPPGAAR